MRITVFHNGTAMYTGENLCTVGVIQGRQERKAFEFIASDFNFSMRNAQNIYDLLASKKMNRVNGLDVFDNDLDVVVEDDSCVWFRGKLSTEGPTRKPGTLEPYSFFAVSSAKSIADGLRKRRMFVKRTYKDERGDTRISSEQMKAAITRETGLKVNDADFTNSNPLIQYLDTERDGYMVWDFLVDCAFEKNSTMWIDENNTLRFKNRTPSDPATVIDGSRMCSYSERLQAPDYEKVIYSTTWYYDSEEYRLWQNAWDLAKANGDNSAMNDLLAQIVKMKKTNGYRAVVEETPDSSWHWAELPEGYVYDGALDVRTPMWERGTKKPSASIFPGIRSRSDKWQERLGYWDDLMQPKKIIEIGLRGLTKYDPYTKIKCDGVTGKIIERQYDIVKKTTTLTIEAE